MTLLKELLEIESLNEALNRDKEVEKMTNFARRLRTKKELDDLDKMLQSYERKRKTGIKNKIYNIADFVSGRWKEPGRMEPLMKIIVAQIEKYDLLGE